MGFVFSCNFITIFPAPFHGSVQVDQYHEESGSRKTVINLGAFVEADHLEWLEDHPTKRPKPRDQRKQVEHRFELNVTVVLQVSIFYSGGDMCDLTGKPRQIEVEMKCKRYCTVGCSFLEQSFF